MDSEHSQLGYGYTEVSGIGPAFTQNDARNNMLGIVSNFAQGVNKDPNVVPPGVQKSLKYY